MTVGTDRSISLSANFRDRADSAAFYEAWVGAVLARAGLYTLHHPFTLASSREDVGEYANTWDLDVGDSLYPSIRPELNHAVPVEVKSVNLTFHTNADYPHQDVLVCSQASWERKWVSDKTKRNFLFVSRPTGAILWLPEGTPVTMNNLVTDHTRNQTYKVVKAAKSGLGPLDAFVRMVKDAG